MNPLTPAGEGASASTPSEGSFSEGSIPGMRPTTEVEYINQNNMPEQSETNDGSKLYGDYQGIIQEDQLRLLFVNINGIPTTADNPKKLDD